MAEIQLFYIGTSKIKEIRKEGAVTYDWGTKGSWTKFKSPIAASKKKIKYNKNTKDAAGSSMLGGNGGVTKLGTDIPANATVYIDGVSRSVPVRYYQRGYTTYQRTSALKKDKKMLRITYTKDKPYQYQLQYKNKVICDKEYSEYVDGTEYIYFADYYYDYRTVDGQQQWVPVETNGHLPHPVDITLSYSDVRRNFDAQANNSDNRDNHGKYVMSNVRANVVTLKLEWTGLSGDEGSDLLDTLNPSGDKNHLVVQYLDPVTGRAVNGTFFASERSVSKYSNGLFKEVSVTLTEV